MATEVRTDVADGVATLTLSYPERRNALNLELSRALAEAVRSAVDDEAVRAVVVTGQAPAFCAGGDLDELDGASPDVLREVYSGFLAVANCPLPTIAAVNGAAVGAGLNLALACDLRLAGPRARFDTRFAQLGLHPGGGYTWLVQRALGPQGAAAMSLFCETLDAAEAERVGLVWRSYPDDEALFAGARELAGRAAGVDRDLLRETKATMRLTAATTAHEQAVEIEVRAQAISVRSADFRERLAALRRRISSR